jgi:acyl-ACP thioesterase
MTFGHWWRCSATGLTSSQRDRLREYPVRFTDIDLFDHMNNAVYWSVVEDYLSSRPELLRSPLRVTLEHEAPIALGDKLEILAHTHAAGSTDRFGAELADRAVRTLTYVAGDQTKAIASVFAL